MEFLRFAVYFAPAGPDEPDGAAASRLRTWWHEELGPALTSLGTEHEPRPRVLSRPALPADPGVPGSVGSAPGPAYAVLRAGLGAPGEESSAAGCPTAWPHPPEGVLFAGIVPANENRVRPLVMDVDSTLIRQEVVDELAAHAGVQDEVAAVTARAMAGELDFAESLRERVATLRGLSTELFGEVGGRLTLSPGARDLVSAFRRRGWPVAAVSGGFLQVLGPLAADVGLDRYRANDLETAGGCLTGRTRGEIVDAVAKERTLRRWCEDFGAPPEDAVAVGDGANDLLMTNAAGLGVAYCAKPALRRVADVRIDLPRLDAVLDLLGIGSEIA